MAPIRKTASRESGSCEWDVYSSGLLWGERDALTALFQFLVGSTRKQALCHVDPNLATRSMRQRVANRRGKSIAKSSLSPVFVSQLCNRLTLPLLPIPQPHPRSASPSLQHVRAPEAPHVHSFLSLRRSCSRSSCPQRFPFTPALELFGQI